MFSGLIPTETSTRTDVVTLLVVGAAVLVSLAPACGSSQLTRERAIEIARSRVSFVPDSVEAMRATSAGRPVWRVTFRGRLPDQPPGLFETAIVELDRMTGEIVSLGGP